MNILWLTWKDYTHPAAGGAEMVLRELSKRLVAEGHTVTFLTVRHPGSAAREVRDGIEIIRIGTNRYLHPFQALAHYLRRMRNRYDAVIEVVNTAPYLAALFKGRAKAFVLCHQLAREIWFHELQRPFSSFGYHVLEPVALRLLSRTRGKLITVSQSTLTDMERFGFDRKHSYIISEGIEIEPVADLRAIRKFEQPTMVSFGALRAMKRTLDQVKAFELAKQRLRTLKLIVAGAADGSYGQQVLDYIADSPYTGDITVEGRVNLKRKIALMQQAHVLTMTSVKEGWGLVVTEAASQGTPAVVYNVDGLRDSVRNGQTGMVCEPNPTALSDSIVQLLGDDRRYDAIRTAAWEWSRELTFDTSYRDFKTVLELT